MIALTMGGRQPKSARQLNLIYEMPNENRSLDDWHRVRNLDLPSFDDLDLDLEERCIVARLCYDPDKWRRVWLLDRRAAIGQERRRRQHTSTRPSLPPPAPVASGWTPAPVRGDRRGR